MSLNVDTLHGQGGGTSTHGERAPRLDPQRYAAWRPCMHVFLTTRGVADAINGVTTIDDWTSDVALVTQWANEDVGAARRTLQAAASSSVTSLSGSTSSNMGVLSEEVKAARKTVRGLVERSQRAFAHIYGALPDDLRSLVAHLPSGHAYGLWQWLEDKYQSRESDNVSNLLMEWSHLEQHVDETFDAYRARVDRLRELMTQANEAPSERAYTFTLLERLQVQYKPVVLALQNGGALKRTRTIVIPATAATTKTVLDVDWTDVVRLINAHERSEHRLATNEGQPGGDHAMSAGRAPVGLQKRGGATKSRQTGAKTNTNATSQVKSAQNRKLPAYDTAGRPKCFNCNVYGHMSAACRQPRAPRDDGEDIAATAQESHSNDDDDGDEHFTFCATEVAMADDVPASASAKPASAAAKRSLRTYASVADAAAKSPASSSSPPAAATVIQPSQAAAKKKPIAHLGNLEEGLAGEVWLIDTGASKHVSGNRGAFGSLGRVPVFGVKVANGDIVQVAQVGRVPLRIRTEDGRMAKAELTNVAYNEQFSSNLLSWSQLCHDGWQLHSSKETGHYLKTPAGSRIPLSMRQRVLTMNTGSLERAFAASEPDTTTNKAMMVLHERLGHMGVDRMTTLINSGDKRVVGLPKLTKEQMQRGRDAVLACTACKHGKMTHTAHGRAGLDKGSQPGEVLHMDTTFITLVHPERGRVVEYALLVRDGHTGGVYFAGCVSKSQIPQAVVHIVRSVGTQMGRTVKRLHMDGGTEFINATVKAECQRLGIVQSWPAPRSPALNGVAERGERTIKDIARTLIARAHAPQKVWRSAFAHAVYVWNRTYISPTTGITPYEAMTQRKPSVKHLGVFGCDAFYHVEKSERTTMEPKAQECIYLGHDTKQNCARVYCLRARKVLLRRDVLYDMSSFQHMRELSGTRTKHDDDAVTEPAIDHVQGDDDETAPPMGVQQEYVVDRISGKKHRENGTMYQVHWRGYTKPTWEPAENVADTEALERFEQQTAPQRRSVRLQSRTTTSPTIQCDDDNSADDDDNDEDEDDDDDDYASEPSVHMAMSAIAGMRANDNHTASDELDTRRAVTTGIRTTKRATTMRKQYRRAPATSPSDRIKFADARRAEIDACERHKVWTEVSVADLPAHANVLPVKWVDKEKSDGRLKSRITPKGFRQKHGVDYFETFASTAMYKTLRLMLSLVAMWDYDLVQMDVPEAFLNATLDEEVYMQMPPGFEKPGVVLRLLKSLYGLCQSPRNWGKLIHGFVIQKLGFNATESDPSLYWRRSRSGRTMLLFRFVDDFEGGCHRDDRAEFDEVISKLRTRFNIKVLPTTDTILGMHLTRDRAARTITLDLEGYIRAALDKYGLSECTAAATPEAVSSAATHDDTTNDQPTDRQRYMEITGTVMYAACAARPDIAHAAHRLASQMQAPTQRDMIAAKRVLRYLSGTRSIGLVFGAQRTNDARPVDSRGHNKQQLAVCAYADADWANDKKDRRSVTGWVAKLNGDLISWASKKQRTVALSTCEAELYAESAAIQELLWLRGMMKELGLNVQTGSVVHGDNQSTIAISKNGIRSERTKHIDVKYRFVTEVIERGDIQLKWVSTTEQQADIFTKALAQPAFEKLRRDLMNA
jgi:hypothetical protein